MDRATFALMTAVTLVLIVYAIVLPSRFQDKPDSQSALVPDGLSAPPAETVNGDNVREEPATSEGGETRAPSVPAHDSGVVNAGKAADASALRGGAAGTPASAAASGTPVTPQTNERQLAAIPPAKTEAAIQPRPDKTAPASPAVAKEAAPAASGIVRSEPSTAGSSPAKKLESMRQPTQAKAATTTSPATRVPPADTGTLAGAKPLQPKAPAVAAVPGRQAQPPSTAPKAPAAGTGAFASVAPAQPGQNGITIQELDRLGETFSRAYEAGDLASLVNLFSEDARTNDQSSRAGIEQDYRDLFELSESRKFTFGRLRWEQDKSGGGLKGEGDFQADVRLKGETGITTVRGKVIFHVQRAPGGVVITEMLHTYN
jgi:hypothetical protein